MVVRARGRRGGGLGGRWGFDLSDAAMGAVLGTVGTAIRQALARYPTLPAAVREAPAEALGLYTLGVAFNRRPLRGVGAGMIIGGMIFSAAARA